MLKNSTLLFSLFICFAQVSSAQRTFSTEQKKLQAVVLGLFDALSELDVQKAKSFCTTDVSILESGQVWNFDSLALRITTRKAKSADFKRINKFDFIETHQEGTIGWVSYFNEAAIRFSGKTVNIKWLETVLLRKVGTEWKICLLHSTEMSRISQEQ